MRRNIVISLVIAALLAGSCVLALRVGQEATVSITVEAKNVPKATQNDTYVLEYYGFCALIAPNGTILEKKVGNVSYSSECGNIGSSILCWWVYSYRCSFTYRFTDIGNYTLAAAIGKVEKIYNFTSDRWETKEEIIATNSATVEVLPIPPPPPTSMEILQRLFELFLQIIRQLLQLPQ
jgi:hypothetical protein